MEIPKAIAVTQKEFDEADPIYKIIIHEKSNIYTYISLRNSKYYISYFSPGTTINMLHLREENLLLIGVDLKVVIISTDSGSILFSLGLFSFFKRFQNTNELTITIFSETEDIVINKNGFSINQIISHEIEL